MGVIFHPDGRVECETVDEAVQWQLRCIKEQQRQQEQRKPRKQFVPDRPLVAVTGEMLAKVGPAVMGYPIGDEVWLNDTLIRAVGHPGLDVMDQHSFKYLSLFLHRNMNEWGLVKTDKKRGVSRKYARKSGHAWTLVYKRVTTGRVEEKHQASPNSN